MYRITKIISIWVLIFVSAFAQERILKSNGELLTSQEIIPLSQTNNTSHHFQPSFYNGKDIIDTLNWGVVPTTAFQFQGKSRMVQWFEAPTDMTIHSVGLNISSVENESSQLSVFLVKLNWTKNQITALNAQNLGYYEATGNGYNDATAFSFDEDRTGDWIWAVDTLVTEPFGDKLWPLEGRKIITPVANENYQWIEMLDLGTEPHVAAGEIFGIVIENLADSFGEDPISLICERGRGIPLFKYYPNGRTDPAEDIGWWSRDFVLDFAVGVTLEGVTPIADVIADENNDFIPDNIGETYNVAGVVTTANFTESLGRLNVYIQDETGGINLYKATLDNDFPIGTKVNVIGEVTQYRGLTELSISSIEKIGLGTVPAPIEITASDWLANPEQYEGKRIKISNVTKVEGDWPAEGSSVNLTMSDESKQNFTMRIDADTDIDGSPEPSYPLDVIGVASQFTYSEPPNDGYQVIPSNYSDLLSNKIPVTFNCDMSVQIDDGNFIPDTGILSVRGDFQALCGDPGGIDWTGNYFRLSDEDGDQIYSITVLFPQNSEGGYFEFKFVRDDIWETNSNRSFNVELPQTILPVYYFDNNSGISPIGDVIVDNNNDFIPDNIGQYVKIRGTITSPNFNEGIGQTNYFIQDSTGGINIYKIGAPCCEIPIGREVIIGGTISQYNGLNQIADINYFWTQEMQPVPEPHVFSNVDEWLNNAEAYEGQLIKLNNVTKVSGDWPTEGNNANLVFTDGTTEFTLRIDADTDIDGSLEPSYPTNIIGLAGQFTTNTPPNDGYQLIPRMISDFVGESPVNPQVTFNCDMSVQIASGNFNVDTGMVVVRGNFQVLLGDSTDWTGNFFQLSDQDGDEVYSLTVDFPEESIGSNFEYKFVMDDIWETNPNRTFILQNGQNNLPVFFYDNDEEINPPLTSDVDVRFNVDMNNNPRNARDGSEINPDEIIFVGIKGGLEELGFWQGNWTPADTTTGEMLVLHDDGTFGDLVANDNIWSRVVTFPAGTSTDEFYFKYGAWYPGAEAIWPDAPMDNEAGYGQDHNFTLYDSENVIDASNVWADQIPQINITPIADVTVDANSDFIPDNIDQTFRIQGVITTPNYNAGINRQNFFVQDATGAVNIYTSGEPCCEIPLGMEVIVEGVLTQYNGLNEIIFNYFETMGVANVPEPHVFSNVGEWLNNAEAYEGQLIKLTNLNKVSGDWPTEGNNANLVFTDGTSEFILRIDADTDIDGSPEPSYPVSVIGIACQFTTNAPPNDGYQILPRFMSDIVPENQGDCILVYPENLEVQATTDFVLPIITENISEGNVVSYQFNLNYDTTYFAAVAPYISTNGSITPSGWFVLGNETEPGTISVAASGATATTGEGELLKVLLHSKELEGESIVSLSDFIYNTGEPCTSTQTGTINISSCTCGDVDCNASVQAYDASLILQDVVGLIDLDTICGCASAGDINLDGELMAYDASMILMNVVGLPVPEPNCFGTKAIIPIAKASEIQLEINPTDIKIENGKTNIELAINGISQNIGVYSLQFEMKNSEELDQLIFNLPMEYLYAVNQENEINRVAIINPNGISSTDLKMNIVTNDEDGINEVVFQNIVINSFKTNDIVLTDLNSNLMVSDYNFVGAYPNPFNPSTKLVYEVPQNTLVTLEIYDILGRLIWSKQIQSERGKHEVEWNGENNYSQKVASGLYFATMKSDNFIKSIKLSLIK